jgi:hypothetical protein
VKLGVKGAVEALNRAGALLVFPVNNKREPESLWSAFFPRSPMVWEWDEDGDSRVANLWHLRALLSTTRKAVYVKWYQGRATYLSRELFPALLRSLNSGTQTSVERSLSPLARQILEILTVESPLSTKEIKRLADLKGKDNEARFQRAMKELWSRLLIVAFGEVDDGAFPSLAVGATRVLFEDLWAQAFAMDPGHALREVGRILPPKNSFKIFFARLRAQLAIPVGPDKTGPSAKAAKRASQSVVSFSDLVRGR